MSLNLWTHDRVDMLRNLWQKGHSARQIAMRMGAGISRNAVIGKAHRLGLSQRYIKTEIRPRETLGHEYFNSCQWPIGDPGDKNFRFCGEKTAAMKPYCRKHCQQAYLNMPSEKHN